MNSKIMGMERIKMMTVISKRIRCFATAPGNDPMDLMKESFYKRKLCDESGFRLPNVHWTMSIAFPSEDLTKAPNLRTVGIQHISRYGADFVVKKGPANIALEGRPSSIVLQAGRYVAGEIAEQWRASGHCETVPLQELLHVIPEYTRAHMVAAKRIEMEQKLETDATARTKLESSCHMTEVVQQIRQEGKFDNDELENAIKAFRFSPDRVERLHGSPDLVLWERWEWTRIEGDACPEGTLMWNNPAALLPH